LPALVIGAGNMLRGDDGAGPEVARRLRERHAGRVRAVPCGGEGAAILQAWQGERRVFVVDAVMSGVAAGASRDAAPPPGTIHRFDAREPLPPGWGRGVSTHALGVAEAVELARQLGQLPERLVIYGIEAREFRDGAPLSAEVERGVEEVVARILEEA
jgi:hydrogenase maturation protease